MPSFALRYGLRVSERPPTSAEHRADFMWTSPFPSRVRCVSCNDKRVKFRSSRERRDVAAGKCTRARRDGREPRPDRRESATRPDCHCAGPMEIVVRRHVSSADLSFVSGTPLRTGSVGALSTPSISFRLSQQSVFTVVWHRHHNWNAVTARATREPRPGGGCGTQTSPIRHALNGSSTATAEITDQIRALTSEISPPSPPGFGSVTIWRFLSSRTAS